MTRQEIDQPQTAGETREAPEPEPATPTGQVVFRELVLERNTDGDQAVQRVAALLTDPTVPGLVVEVRGRAGQVEHLVGVAGTAHGRAARALGGQAGSVVARRPVRTARRVTLSTNNRPLAVETRNLAAAVAAVLGALAQADRNEELVLQVIMGRRLKPRVVTSAATGAVSWWDLLTGRDAKLDAGGRSSLAAKVGQAGARAIIRIGALARSPERRQHLILGLLGALRQLEAPGLSIGLTPEAGRRLDLAALPWRWPTSLNATELAALLALPVGEADLPGLAPVHPRQLAPARGVLRPSRSRVVVAEATAGGPTTNGEAAWLTRSDDALLRHLHVIGPTGVGKSVLLLNLVLQDMARGAGAVVIEPKGDLVADLLERVPDGRRGDVVVFDPTCPDGVVGLNPLAGSGSPELRADRVLSIFTDIFGEALGPRTTDILHACLLTLARRDDASLVQVPRLLTDPAFRRARVGPVAGDLALGPFWAWYEGLRDGERSSVIAPLMNKLRAVVLLNPFVRRTLGQVRPRFDVGQVFTEQKILLVPLPVASLGSEGSALLGSLVVGQVWQAARARIHQPIAERRPVPVVLDECQQFLRLSDLPDALATSRSYGVGWVLAHQYLAQLPPDLRAAVLTNCRSRVAFQTSHDDAQTLARESGGRLEADDFTALPAFHVYASLLEHGQVQPYASGRTLPPPPVTADANGLRRASAARYGRTPAEIEAGFLAAPDVPPGHPSGVGRTSVESAHGDGTDSSIGRMRRPATVDVVSSRSSGRVEPSQANPLVGMPIEAVKATATLPPGVVLDAGADRGAGNSQATDQGAPAADEASTDEVGRSRP